MPFCGLSSNWKHRNLGIALLVAFCLPTTHSEVFGMWQGEVSRPSTAPSSDVRPLVSDLSLGRNADRVLMLQNGAVFSGKIEKQDGKWKIDLANHATLYFQNHQVRVVADSIEDIYLFQSQKTSQFDVQQKTDMVRWCLKNKLLPQAEREFGELSRLRISPDLKRSLEVQLAALRNPMAASLPSIANAAALRPQTNPKDAAAQTQSPIVLAESQPKKSAKPITRPTTNSQRDLPVASVFKIYDVPGMKNSETVQDAIDRQLSDVALETFSHSTHQVLIEACGACHFQGNSGIRSDVDFELQLAAADSTEAMRHNLQQVMNLLNRENPGNSELLSIASSPHGGMKRPPVATESLAQKTLMNWVFSTRIDNGGRTPDKTMLESRVQLAGAEVIESGAGDSPLGQLTPTINPANPYDPAGFNQQQSTSRYQLPSTATPQRESAFPPATTSLDPKAMSLPDSTPTAQSQPRSFSGNPSPLPRPTSMFSLRSLPESHHSANVQTPNNTTGGATSDVTSGAITTTGLQTKNSQSKEQVRGAGQ